MLFPVMFAPAGVTTWMGGSESHQSTIADAGATPANERAAAITAAAGRILKSLISSLRVEPVTDATNGVDEAPLPRHSSFWRMRHTCTSTQFHSGPASCAQTASP